MLESKRTEKQIGGFGLLYENHTRQAVSHCELTNVSYFYLYNQIKKYQIYVIESFFALILAKTNTSHIDTHI